MTPASRIAELPEWVETTACLALLAVMVAPFVWAVAR